MRHGTSWSSPAALAIGTVVAAVSSLVALSVFSVAPSAAAGAAGTQRTTVRIGRPPRVPPASKHLAPLAPTARLHVDVVLQPRDPAGLARYAQEVSVPGSALYRRFLSEADFTAEFGPTQLEVDSVRSTLVSAGLTPGPTSPNNMVVPITASAKRLTKAFSTGIEEFQLPGGRVAYANTSAPQLPGSVAPYVQGVVGLDDLYHPAPQGGSQLVRAPSSRSGRPSGSGGTRGAVQTGGAEPCSAASAVPSEVSSGAYTADQIASAYGFQSLYTAGDLGAGQTVALYELQGFLPKDIAAFQSCYRTSTDIKVVAVDGGDPARAGGETEGDIETVLSLAPDVNILVYEAPNSGTGPLDEYNAIVAQDLAKVISTSWGECEAYLGQAAASAENTVFEEAAVQGQTVFAASGDGGSEDCGGSALGVDDPASQPFVTSVGGTQWLAAGTPPSEETWNADWGASGGGLSSIWSMPSYQQDAPATGVIDAYSSRTPCGAPSGSYCREVPDVSALAGIFPYVVYLSGGWDAEGGTSLAAPLWASLVALTDASSACDGSIVGFANPDLYEVAASDPGAFHDITRGNNDYTFSNGGRYPALTGYDMATGLGTPDGARLPQDLCAGATPDPVSLGDPGAQQSDLGQQVSLRLVASDSAAGRSVSYEALGLPAGLSLDSSSGVVSGAPSTAGTSTVIVNARDSAGASDSVTFDWSVAPSVTRIKPTFGPGAGGTKVTIKGEGFGTATAVLFGSTEATNITVNKRGTTIRVIAPPGTGAVQVAVTGSSGTSPATFGTGFSYAPAVTRVNPSSGPPSGGTRVVVEGSNFSGVSSVRFGAVQATSFTVDSSKRITAVSPSGSLGTVNVIVTTTGGSSVLSTSDEYTYTAATSSRR
jgi:hypothetical protein